MKELTLTCAIKLYDYDELSESDRQLVDAAKEATFTSYAPYSKFNVGAAARLSDGTIVTGSNQENAAYPSGLCAERTTLFYAGAHYPDKAVVALAVAARSESGYTATPIPPCGACRQVIIETEKRHKAAPIRTLLYGDKGTYVIEGGAGALLPIQFDESFLE